METDTSVNDYTPFTEKVNDQFTGEKISQEKAKRICSHINSYYRPNSGKCAFDIFVDAFGEKNFHLKKLGIVRIGSHIDSKLKVAFTLSISGSLRLLQK